MSQLPLISLAATFYPKVSLNNTGIIAVQHLLNTTHDMFKSWVTRGLKFENLFVLGKCYSSNSTIFLRMNADGICVSRHSLCFYSHWPFDSQFEQFVSEFIADALRQIRIKNLERIILIDDGGYLIRKMSKRNDLFHGQIAAVEQTTAGYEIIKDLSLEFPVVNVAKSRVKLKSEYAMVADLIIDKVHHILKEKRRNILILGHGMMGETIKKALSMTYYISCFDNAANPHHSLEELLPHAELIIGCTGKISLPADKHHLIKKGCILASASSSDREFDAVYIRKNLSPHKNCHLDINNGHIVLLNGGFPINFTGEMQSVPPEKIQLTRALITLGILQSCCESGRKGLIDLNEDLQLILYNLYQSKHFS